MIIGILLTILFLSYWFFSSDESEGSSDETIEYQVIRQGETKHYIPSKENHDATRNCECNPLSDIHKVFHKK